MMYRLQVSLSEQQYEFLQSEAFVAGKSMAAVVRKILDEAIAARQQEALTDDPIWASIGIGNDLDAPSDISANVDHYLYGQPEQARPQPQSLPKVAEDGSEYNTD